MNNRITISLCMIVKDEEKTLERCLSSIKDIVDEIIIVDTGSTDKTKEIAKKFNSKIYDFKWIDDFAAARNFSFSKATKEYIFWLDGDDYLDDENINNFKDLKDQLDRSVDTVTMEYSLTRDENGQTTYSLRRNRLVKRRNGFKWIGRVHEYLDVGGVSFHSNVCVNHGKVKSSGSRNLEIFKKMEASGVEFTTRDLFYYSNELYYNGYYEEAITKYEKFLDSNLGWIEDKKVAIANLIQCYSFTNKPEKKIEIILKSFEFDVPRADICCRLAEIFMSKNQIKQAIFWYKVAMGCIHEKDNLGIDNRDYYTWIPSIQLCVCYSILGDYEAAYYYNELTLLYGGNKTKVEHNKKFLENKFKELGISIPDLDYKLIDRRFRFF